MKDHQLISKHKIIHERLLAEIQTQNHIEIWRVSINLIEQQSTYKQHYQVTDDNDNSYGTDTFCCLIKHFKGANVQNVNLAKDVFL